MDNMQVIKRLGESQPLNISKIHDATQWATEGLDVSQSELETAAHLMLFDGIRTSDIQKALIVSAAGLITVDQPDYTFVAARLLLQVIYKEVTGGPVDYPHLRNYIEKGVEENRLNPELLKFDLEYLDKIIQPERDFQFDYLGLQTIADRYLITTKPVTGEKPRIIELPQHFWMRVAMGLALNEDDREARAAEFYGVLSKFEYVSSTPTLFNAGTNHSQLSSCFGNTVEDSITGIFEAITECAHISKYAGGIGTDWTRVRGAGSPILGTNGKSSGIVPYLKVYNDTALAVNQSSKRNGAFAPYLQPWHPDFLDFIDLKKNSGDERRRAHDIYPAAWLPDLFMKRVKEKGMWSFFSPVDVPEMNELHGEAFEAFYCNIEYFKPELIRSQIPAEDLWRKMLNSLFETGHPWITFKDTHNRRNPQDHVGIIRNSNLCTEISLNNNDLETYVCNLGSVNLSKITDNEDYHQFFERVIPTAMRMLDNVIDINFYPSEKARLSNMQSRPVGLGMMGYTEYLVKQGIDWESDEHLALADDLTEAFSYYAIRSSCYLASDRGAYPTFAGSKWSKGILPIDTAVNIDTIFKSEKLYPRYNWGFLREYIQREGMRNSNCMAVAPTATIANIVGTTPCIEPIYQRTTEKTNLSGTFTLVDPALRHGRPDLCKEAFDIDQTWLIKAAAVRQRWIDQSQSINLFIDATINGRKLSELYFLAWELGLKSTYYLKSKSAEMDKNKLAATVETEVKVLPEQEIVGAFCSGPDCTSCE